VFIEALDYTSTFLARIKGSLFMASWVEIVIAISTIEVTF
jgi:hypothetical protein